MGFPIHLSATGVVRKIVADNQIVKHDEIARLSDTAAHLHNVLDHLTGYDWRLVGIQKAIIATESKLAALRS
jgi:hypothetical protein